MELKDSNRRETFDFGEVKLLKGDHPGTVEGYGSVFNLLDRGGDIVMPGAFAKSIAEMRRKEMTLPMLWQHDSAQPVGIWTDLTENDKGLKVKGELILDVPQAAIAHALLKKSAVTGLSIGYQTKQAEIDRVTGARKLKEVQLWEVSLVTFPMMPEAQITGVKADFDPRELEADLRDAGLSRSDAVKAVARFRKCIQRDAGGSEPGRRDGAADVLMEMRKLTEKLRAA